MPLLIGMGAGLGLFCWISGFLFGLPVNFNIVYISFVVGSLLEIMQRKILEKLEEIDQKISYSNKKNNSANEIAEEEDKG